MPQFSCREVNIEPPILVVPTSLQLALGHGLKIVHSRPSLLIYTVGADAVGDG